jgi:DNA-binding response OmpR family regulator
MNPLEASSSSAGSLKKRRVFVVDDEGQIADLLSLFLRDAGFDVDTFQDGHSCLIKAQDSQPDVVVTDVSMPGMDGIALAKILRTQCPNCKVILISGNPEWKTRPQALDGFVLLPKPFVLSQLLRLIDT